MKAIEDGEASLLKATETARAARKAEAKAQTALDRFADEEAGAWKKFEKARDALATLGPPRTDREDLGEAWSSFQLGRETALPENARSRRKPAKGGKCTRRAQEGLRCDR